MENSGKDERRVLSENLKRFREKLGLNQLALAEAAKLSIGAIRQIETCVRWPRPDTLNKIATALGVHTNDLLGRKVSRMEEPTPTVESLLKALIELQKENQALKDMIPADLKDIWEHATKTEREFLIENVRSRMKMNDAKKA